MEGVSASNDFFNGLYNFRLFHLILRPSLDSFHPDLLHHSNHNIRFDQFFSGHVLGEESSHVIAHVTTDNILTAVIRIGFETYYIEVSNDII